jgi:hypothetical protein
MVGTDPIRRGPGDPTTSKDPAQRWLPEKFDLESRFRTWTEGSIESCWRLDASKLCRYATVGAMRIGEIVLVALLASACGSPTAETCVNGVDQLGRGPTVLLTAQCSPVGSDLACVGKVDQAGYCANTATITGKTQWISREPDVAAFENSGATVGVLRAMTAGVAEVYFTFGVYGPSETIAFAVAPGSTPERMLRLSIVMFASSVSSTSPRLSGVALNVQPDRGPVQTCQTNQNGACEFWVLSGDIKISATKDGYTPAQITSTPNALDGSFLKSVPLALTPLPPS